MYYLFGTADQTNALVNPVAFSFGSANATLSCSDLAGYLVGIYEFYITVPLGLANGDYPRRWLSGCCVLKPCRIRPSSRSGFRRELYPVSFL